MVSALIRTLTRFCPVKDGLVERSRVNPVSSSEGLVQLRVTTAFPFLLRDAVAFAADGGLGKSDKAKKSEVRFLDGPAELMAAT